MTWKSVECKIADLGAHGEASDVEDCAQHASTKPLLGAQRRKRVKDGRRQSLEACKLSVWSQTYVHTGLNA